MFAIPALRQLSIEIQNWLAEKSTAIFVKLLKVQVLHWSFYTLYFGQKDAHILKETNPNTFLPELR
jgi:hypothetical protein